MPSHSASKASPSQGASVRFNGCSNYPAWELAKAPWTSDKLNLARYACVQPRYNILFRHIETELLPLCRDQGGGVIAYNPLAGGFLTGRYQPGQDVQAGAALARATLARCTASATGRRPSSPSSRI